MRATEVPVVLGRNVPASERAASNPCDGCSAPCCKLVLARHRPPQTFMALDHLRFMAGFPDTELLLQRDGGWQVATWSACRHLDGDDACTVRGTERHPKTCVFFNPYDCWYKRNFHAVDPDDAPDLIRIDLGGFDEILAAVTVDDDGAIVEVPPFDELRRLARKGRLRGPSIAESKRPPSRA